MQPLAGIRVGDLVLEQAVRDPHCVERELFACHISVGTRELAAAPGEANRLLGSE